MSKENNDELIQKLTKIVETKKEEISKIEKTTYKTNCLFKYNDSFNDKIYNLNTINNVDIIIKISSFIMEKEYFHSLACDKLGIKKDFIWDGYLLDDWLTDLKSRLGKIELSLKKKELSEFEGILESKLSKGLKDKLELEKMLKTLNNY